jgi:hypothetical protein
VTGEVIKILFLGEDIRLRILFATGQSGEYYRRVHGGGKPGAALGVNGVGLALAALLRGGGRRKGERGHRQQDQNSVAGQRQLPA